MAEIQFIENNPEKIVQETIAKYNEYAGYTLAPADAERIMIDVIAYRESLLRSSMERAMRSNFVQTASEKSLDYWGELFGVIRSAGQEDEAYRALILNQSKLDAIGTRSAYIAKIKTIENIADVLMITKQDDTTIPPGAIRLSIIQKRILQNGLPIGQVAEDTLLTSVRNVVSDKATNIVGDIFEFEPAIPIAINGSVQVRKSIGASIADFTTSLNYQIDKYFGELSLSFTSTFGENDLERQLMRTTGINQVLNLSFVNVPILRRKNFYTKGNITIDIL